MRGTADAFNPLSQAPAFHATMRPQGLRYCQGVRGARVFNGPHVPKRPRPVLRESAAVQGRQVFGNRRCIVHCVPFLPTMTLEKPQILRFSRLPPDGLEPVLVDSQALDFRIESPRWQT